MFKLFIDSSYPPKKGAFHITGIFVDNHGRPGSHYKFLIRHRLNGLRQIFTDKIFKISGNPYLIIFYGYVSTCFETRPELDTD